MGVPREEMRETVPRVIQINIPTDKIGAVIGPGGKMIREITEQTGAKIDIEDDGLVKIASADAAAAKRAVEWIRGLTATAELGQIYEGKVVGIVDFGAFINFMGKHEGLCHISELENERVNKVTDVLKEGDTVKVKVIAIDERGRVKLSRRAVDQETGEELPVQPRAPRPDRPRFDQPRDEGAGDGPRPEGRGERPDGRRRRRA
jgi:polyribonucleotide nucleotidyltransferase